MQDASPTSAMPEAPDRRAEPAACLAATRFIDADDTAVRAFARAAAGDAAGDRARAVAIYYRVRDDIRYDPYSIDLTPAGMQASTCLALGRGFCIAKGVLLAACLRAQGIPARLGFADVRNHLATERLLELLGTDLFAWHGYVEAWLDGRWVKATPAFNLALCEKFGVKPLEFDGVTDSVFHAFDTAGRRHMEYVRDRGSFADLPFETIAADFRAIYPRVFGDGGAVPGGDFAAGAAARQAGG